MAVVMKVDLLCWRAANETSSLSRSTPRRFPTLPYHFFLVLLIPIFLRTLNKTVVSILFLFIQLCSNAVYHTAFAVCLTAFVYA